jgi:murein DD-endopeptidase MepM/ murein hydrolase activator NlpD
VTLRHAPGNKIIAIALVLAFIPSLGLTRPSTLQQKIEAARQRNEKIQARLHQKRQELHNATIKVNGLQDQLDQTNAAIGQVNARISDINYQTGSTERRLDWNSVQLRAAEASLQLHDQALKKRLVDIYENGELSYAQVLLSAQSFSGFVERWEDLRLLIRSNQDALRDRRAAEQKVANIQRDLQRTQIELSQEHQQQQEAQNQLGTLADERRNLVAVADQQRRHVATQVAEMEDLSASEEANLEALIRQRQAEIAAQHKASGVAGNVPSGGPGRFAWPVSGTITSPFGWRSSPFGGSPEFHQGLDIAAPTGTTVKASAGGTIIMAQWYGGYGNYILIDNGGNYSTGYGHLSAIYVAVGQSVQAGQAIGAVGSTGASTGPHLHFEIRVNGKPVDPAARLH